MKKYFIMFRGLLWK